MLKEGLCAGNLGKKLCVLALSMGMSIASTITGFAVEDGAYRFGHDVIMVKDDTFQWEETDIALADPLPDGAYKVNGAEYRVEAGEFLSDAWRDGVYYTPLGPRAGCEDYEFQDGLEEAFYDALENIASTPADGSTVFVLKGMPLYDEALFFRLKADTLYNFSDTPLPAFVGGKAPDSYTFMRFYNDEETHQVIMETLEARNRLDAVYVELGIDGMSTEQEKVKAIHDWLIHNISYDDALENKRAYEGMKDGKMVCIGYAQCFYYMVQKAGIEVELVSGVGLDEDGTFNMNENRHAWNRVRFTGEMEWKYVDVTWDENIAKSFADLDMSERSDEEKQLIENAKYTYYLLDRDTFQKDHFAFYYF